MLCCLHAPLHTGNKSSQHKHIKDIDVVGHVNIGGILIYIFIALCCDMNSDERQKNPASLDNNLLVLAHREQHSGNEHHQNQDNTAEPAPQIQQSRRHPFDNICHAESR
ncbi:MAG: hypothetical protein MAGBODY4_00520 [Candidatus Marinimicrobia bacterium]|nr:hypothetical protein [Candidatus Neomarinimicrobiota bacterium]